MSEKSIPENVTSGEKSLDFHPEAPERMSGQTEGPETSSMSQNKAESIEVVHLDSDSSDPDENGNRNLHPPVVEISSGSESGQLDSSLEIVEEIPASPSNARETDRPENSGNETGIRSRKRKYPQEEHFS